MIRTRDAKYYLQRGLLYLVLTLSALTMVVPFAWMVTTSLKPTNEVFTVPLTVFGSRLEFENYVRLFERFPFMLYLFNSLKVTLSVVLLQLFTSCMAGYVFARIKFRGVGALFLLYLATMMVPFQVTVIPNFIIMKTYKLVDTHWSLILPAVVSAYGTFLMRQFFVTVPQALEDSAKIDGCNHFQIFSRIMLPMAKPTITTLLIFIFMGVWNDFFNPFIYINSDKLKTLPLGIATMQGLYMTDWPVLMAGAFLSIIPVLIAFLVGQDQFVKGVMLSGMKD